MMNRLRDAFLELRIRWVKRLAVVFTLAGHRLWRVHAELIGRRSGAQVERMEKRMGLL